MSLFDPPQSAELDTAQLAADSLLAHPLAELYRRIEYHRDRYRQFWDDPNAAPAQICERMGTGAATFLSLASKSVTDIAALISIGAPEKTLDDFMPPEWYTPRLPLTPNDDGTVTVGTVEGLDAWGNPIPQPEQPTTEQPAE